MEKKLNGRRKRRKEDEGAGQGERAGGRGGRGQGEGRVRGMVIERGGTGDGRHDWERGAEGEESREERGQRRKK